MTISHLLATLEDRLDQIDWNVAWYGILDNSLPMSWNLFLALLPLGLSCVLFYRPRSPIVHGGIWLLVGVLLLPNLERLGPFSELVGQTLGLIPVLGAIALLPSMAAIGFWKLGRERMKALVWWPGSFVFILLLPNAAYILTDVIHFVIDVRKGYPMGTIVAILLPQYLLFMTVGFQSYVASLMNVGFFLEKRGWEHAVFPVELGIHAVSAIGIYLGRFSRFNSWDVLTNLPGLLQDVGQTFSADHALLVIGILFGVLSAFYWLCKRINIGLLAQKEAFRATI
ncbi:MAG: DUF1361 domain-containing protein [Kovacikia sp.]